jgi:hypothetical protein
VLFLLDAGKGGGTLTVTASIGGSVTGMAKANVTVGVTPPGNVARGNSTYTSVCATCHGPTGNGSPPETATGPGSMIYVYAGLQYPYPAPGLNNGPCNTVSLASWNPGLLAMAARADMDNVGVTLRSPMLNGLDSRNPLSALPLSTQDYADIYAWLKTQNQ